MTLESGRLCSFDGVGHVTAKTAYAELRRRALAAGRFSVFEATASPAVARLFDRLCADPAIETRAEEYPWTSVRLRVRP